MVEISRAQYAALYGATTGDQVRLGDTDLWIEVERDLTVGGEEVVFGGGKSIRESMAQGVTTRADGALDTVVTNALVLDWWGVVKADVGIRDGRIVALGRAGNPDVADGVHPDLHIGPATDVVAGEGKILTAGAIDSHVHLLSPSQVHEALATGVTTVIGGGTGPSEGSKATTVTPGSWHLAHLHRALDPLPVNVVLLGKGNTVSVEGLAEQALAGAGGYKVHEDWGSTPAALDAALTAAGEWGLQVALHSDSLNEAGYVDSTRRAIGGRSISAFHIEGAGGGHSPDILTLAGDPNVLPGSTNPTLPHTVNTVAEHLDMLMVCHHLSPDVPEDLAFAESRIRPTTIAAEDVLHDLGAISITSSDAQAMGRIGEVVTRTWQVAHVMKARRGSLGESLPADNERARRYVAKYTINPAVAHGIDATVGSVEAGKLADLTLLGAQVLRRPAVGRHQGRGDRLGRPRRPERLDPDPAARPDAPLVRRHHGRRPLGLVGRARRPRRRSRRTARPAPDAAPGAADARGRQGPDAQQRRPARDRGRRRDLRHHRGRRPGRARTGRPAAARAALLPVLMDAPPVTSPELVALMLADARLPTGGHTQSAGLEPAVLAGLADDGRALGDVEAYARDRQRTVVRVEAGTAVVTRSVVLAGGDPLDVVPHWAARTPSRAQRASSGRMGRGYLRLAERIWPAVLDHLPRDAEVARPVVLGVIGAVTGLDAAQVARLTAYDDAQTVVAASLKLLPVDPAAAAGWLVALHPDLEACVEAVAGLTDPESIPACGAPLVDLYAEQHATAKMRLFHA